MNVIIGVDPHKASHHAFAVDDHEQELAQISVRATRTQTTRLLAWAEPFQQRTWAIEGAGGLGYLLSQQLVAVGERVVDVPAYGCRKRGRGRLTGGFACRRCPRREQSPAFR